MRKRTIVTILVSISALLLFSGLLYAQDYEVIVMDKRQVTKTYDFEKNGDIYVKNVTGDIRISGWNQNKIDIDIQRRGRRDDIEVIIDRRGKSFYIEVDYPDIDYRWDNDRNSGSVHFTIKVPEETELDIENATGDIIVTGINARVEASTATGDVELSKIKGEVYGKTATGSVEVYDVDGSVDAHSATGRIRVRSTGDVDANSATGTIDIFSSNARNLEASVATGRVDVELAVIETRRVFRADRTTVAVGRPIVAERAVTKDVVSISVLYVNRAGTPSPVVDKVRVPDYNPTIRRRPYRDRTAIRAASARTRRIIREQAIYHGEGICVRLHGNRAAIIIGVGSSTAPAPHKIAVGE